ncbi:unnamed protein product [Rotaria sp. Silwood1]|nr:unnamed protein product [Rotaria sp. Silwood1]
MTIINKSVVLSITLVFFLICNNAYEEDSNLDGANFSRSHKKALRKWLDLVLGKRAYVMNTDACPAFTYNCDLHLNTAPYNYTPPGNIGTTFYPARIRLSNGTITNAFPRGSFGGSCDGFCNSDDDPRKSVS